MSERIPMASTVCTTEEILLDPYVRSLVHEAEASQDDPEVLVRLAAALNARLMHEKARDACQAGLARNPRHPGLFWELIRAASHRGREALEPLVEEARRLREESGGAAWTERNLGLLYYFLGEDEPCREASERALRADPREGRAHEVLAYRAYTLGDREKAIEHCIQAVELDPGNYRAQHWLGECYKEADALEPAERCFLHALQVEENDFLSLESLGELYLRKQETHAKAIQCFSRILSVNPRNWTVYLRFAEWHLGHGRPLEAAAQCLRLLRLRPDPSASADAHQYLGIAHFQEGRLREAEAEFRLALASDPEYAPPYYYLGLIAESEKDEAAAEGLWRKALDKDPVYAEPAVSLGYLHFDGKQYEEAERWFRQALECNGEAYEAHLGLSEVRRARRDWKGALDHCRKALEVEPGDTNGWNQLGIAHDALGETGEAIDAYRRALEIDPRNRQAANNLGYLYERLLEEEGSPEWKERAVAAWKRRLLICRDTAASTRGARAHLRKLGVSEDAVEEWLEGATIEPVADGL